MKSLKAALCGAIASVAMAGAAQAQEVSFNVGAATDYIFRGIDQSQDHNGHVFVGADVTMDMFYAGLWVTNTGPNNNQAIEYDVYAGIKPEFGGATFDLGLIYYGYSNDTVVNDNLNTLEVKAAVSYPIGKYTIGGAIYYADENGGFGDVSSIFAEATAAYTFEAGPTASVGLGYGQFDIPTPFAPPSPPAPPPPPPPIDQYMTWNVGVTFPFTDHFSLDLRYHGNDKDAEAVFGGALGPNNRPIDPTIGQELADDHVVLTAKYAF